MEGRSGNIETLRNAHIEGPVKETEEYPDGEVGAVTVVPAGWDFKA